ncbi:helix-turn-helix domain-containing protein [Sunxiuqinia sp. A32]|uniref:helix-turn-helix domain-containing protein n=1 Tax=Sunxiuqinia sp. A32 TaxID=3461496 RepID=UPI004045A323
MDLAIEFERLKEGQTKIIELLCDNQPKFQEHFKVYTITEIANLLSVTNRTIYNWKEQGILPCTIVGSKTYITQKQLDEFLSLHEVKPVNRGRRVSCI